MCIRDRCSADTDYVFIHDGARPFVTEDIIKRTKEVAVTYQACIAAVSYTHLDVYKRQSKGRSL